MAEMDLLNRVIDERPAFHSSETEIQRAFDVGESFLDQAAAKELSAGAITCYGIGADVLSFIADSVGEETRSLETGAGCSTLVFAIRRANHIAVTPSVAEIERIRAWADSHGIMLDTVQFVAEPSERYLCGCPAQDLDLVLLDGKHAFPWPIVDWFYTADRLRRDGVLLIDDVQMRSVRVLAEFLRADPGWELLHEFSGKTLAFRKTRDSVLDVAWHMQPWTMADSHAFPQPQSPGLFARVRRRLTSR